MHTIQIKNTNEEIPVGKIVCVGRNYAAHAKELGNEVPEKPVVFIKPASAIIHSGEQIVYPPFSNDMHHEVELVLFIGKQIKNADQTQAEDAISGYGVGLDMTLRDIQNKLKQKGHPWTIAKCFDTSAVLSGFISKNDYKLTLEEEISLSVNSIIKQKEKLNLMLFPPAQIVQYISSLMKLDKGDIIFTGTPAGVGKVEKGDKIQARIAGIAELECSVV